MWQIKMKVVLIKEKCWKAVKGEFSETLKDDEIKELDEQAHSEIMIRLSDEVARQVVSITNSKLLWNSLEQMYLTKSMPSRISLLCRLFTFKMDVSLSLHANLDKFLKMTQDLERCGDKIVDSHQAVILLNSLPAEFDGFKDVIQYGRDELSKTKIV